MRSLQLYRLAFLSCCVLGMSAIPAAGEKKPGLPFLEGKIGEKKPKLPFPEGKLFVFSPEQIRESAAKILTGKILRIYTSVEETTDNLSSRTPLPRWYKKTFSVAELLVTGVEKGEYSEKLAYIRFEHEKRDSGPPIGPRYVPKVGETARAYISLGEHGGMNVLRFETLVENSAKK